jgi:sulfatase modifying factor 1
VRITLVVATLMLITTSAKDQSASPPAPTPKPTLTNSIGMEFVLIQPGTLRVGRFEPNCPSAADRRGSPDQDPRTRWTPEDTTRCEQIVQHERQSGFVVTLPRPYYIGKYEVTQGQWMRVMGTNPSTFQRPRVGTDTTRYPVDSVTWDDAQRFVQRLNERERTTAYRLPTEFEWEYAARAGAATDPTWDEIRERAWEQDITTATTHPVGLKQPNPWGLHDMLGNVWEWVNDYYNDKIFADPAPPSRGTTHVLKGGGFLSDVKNTTWSTHAAGPGDAFDVGFRIVRESTVR